MIAGFASHPRVFDHDDRPRADGWEEQRLLNLRDALEAMYEGEWDLAEKALIRRPEHALGDASILNLLGIVHQARRQWKEARRFYGRAMKADGCYAPAERNLRRFYELHTFGATDIPMAFIDAATACEVQSRFAIPLMRQ
jgi:tetratricopeptide (TPR) repeat protein